MTLEELKKEYNLNIFEEKSSKMAYISIFYIDKDTKKRVRKKRSTGLIYNKKNITFIENKIFPELLKEFSRGRGILISSSENLELVEDIISELIKELKAQEGYRREYTVRNYEKDLQQHFIPAFGYKKIKDITTNDLQEFFVSLQVSPKRLANLKIPINHLFQKAMRMNLLDKNPLLYVDKNLFKTRKHKDTNSLNSIEEKINKIEEEDNNIDPFSEEEIKTILNTAKGKFKNYLAILFFTGMRPSELIYLEWKNVDFEKRVLIVEGAITGKQTDKERNLTKTYASRRTVYLSSQAIFYFQKQFIETGSFESTVFLNQYCKPYSSPDSLRDNDWKKLFDMPRKQNEKGKVRKTEFVKNNMGIRYREIYNMRHSFASINLSLNRLPLLLVSKQLGHATADITLKKYSSYKVDSTEITLDILDKSVENF